LIAGLSLEGAEQASGQSAMENLHQTSVKGLLVPFHACIMKEGFKFWVVGKKVISFTVKNLHASLTLVC
jgi:hypothetical protein